MSTDVVENSHDVDSEAYVATESDSDIRTSRSSCYVMAYDRLFVSESACIECTRCAVGVSTS